MEATESKQVSVVQAVSAVSKSIGAVGKNKSGPQAQGGFKYRGVEDIQNALHGALNEHGVVIVPNVESFEIMEGNKGWVRAVVTIRYDVYGPAGDKISGTVVADGLDAQDKAFGKAMSYAYKSFVLQFFCIPTQDLMQDNEAESRYDPSPEPRRRAIPQAPKQQPGPMSLERVQKGFLLLEGDLAEKAVTMLEAAALWPLDGISTQPEIDAAAEIVKPLAAEQRLINE